MRLLGQSDFLRMSAPLNLNPLLGYHLKSPSKGGEERERRRVRKDAITFSIT